MTEPNEHVEERDIEDAFVRMGEIIAELEESEDAATRDKVFELLDWVDGFHREAVVRIAGLLPPEALAGLREDPVVSHLFSTYLEENDEEPEELGELLEGALEEIRPYLHSHGGEMEVLDVENGVVKMRLMGSCHGCPSSTVTLTQGVEKIMKERWPGFRRIDVEGFDPEPAHPPKLLQIESLKRP